MRLLSASLLKLWRRPATRRTGLVLLGILALIYLSIAGSLQQITDPVQRAQIEQVVIFPAAYTGLGTFLVSFGGLAAAALAGLVAGSEWSWGTFRVAVARGESRVRYVIATFVALAMLIAVALGVVYIVGIGLVVVGDLLGGLNPGDLAEPTALGRLPAIVAGMEVAVLTAAAMGFAIAFVLRNQIAGIVGVVGLSFAEQFLGLVIPRDVLRFGPTTSGNSLVTEAGQAGFGGDWLLFAGTSAAYLILAIALAVLFARRSEVA